MNGPEAAVHEQWTVAERFYHLPGAANRPGQRAQKIFRQLLDEIPCCSPYRCLERRRMNVYNSSYLRKVCSFAVLALIQTSHANDAHPAFAPFDPFDPPGAQPFTPFPLRINNASTVARSYLTSAVHGFVFER
jgi:hypothetical protein